MKMNKILLVGSQHGNELLGVRLYEYFCANYPDVAKHVDYICANPLAFAENKRFIESDLNRSFNGKSTTYEERRAQELLTIIHSDDYNYIIDVHTSTSKELPFFISPSLNSTRKAMLASAETINTIVIMPDDIASHSLMGQFENAVSIEINEAEATTTSTLEVLCRYLNALLRGESYRVKRDIFYTLNLLRESDITPGEEVKNYHKLQSGYYPILYGETNYQGYIGFKADRKEQVEL